jgi:hypothetical protein
VVPPNFTLQLASGLTSARRPSRLGLRIPLRRHVSCTSLFAASAALRQLPCRSAAASMKPLAAECEIRWVDVRSSREGGFGTTVAGAPIVLAARRKQTPRLHRVDARGLRHQS